MTAKLTTNLPGILPLVELIKTHFQQHEAKEAAIGQEITRVLALLETIPPASGEFSKNHHPVARYFEAALGAGTGATSDILAAVRPVIGFLPWYNSYPKRDDDPDLGERIAFAEIIGPEAPLKSASVCLGLTLIGPDTYYPPHAHPAIELYYVISGTGTWTADGISRKNPPGAFILHPSEIVHAMQADREPLLAVYSWTGTDVRTTSFYV
jgi:quercetin dioxygenase-like cupin family protein